jgi:hypothetical protein
MLVWHRQVVSVAAVAPTPVAILVLRLRLLKDSAGIQQLGSNKAASATARRQPSSTAAVAVVVVAQTTSSVLAVVAAVGQAVSGLQHGLSPTAGGSQPMVETAQTEAGLQVTQVAVGAEPVAMFALALSLIRGAVSFKRLVVLLAPASVQVGAGLLAVQALQYWLCCHENTKMDCV